MSSDETFLDFSGRFSVNKKPMAEDLKVKINWIEKTVRLQFRDITDDQNRLIDRELEISNERASFLTGFISARIKVIDPTKKNPTKKVIGPGTQDGYEFDVSYSFLKKECTIRGDLGGRKINRVITDLAEILTLIKLVAYTT